MWLLGWGCWFLLSENMGIFQCISDCQFFKSLAWSQDRDILLWYTRQRKYTSLNVETRAPHANASRRTPLRDGRDKVRILSVVPVPHQPLQWSNSLTIICPRLSMWRFRKLQDFVQPSGSLLLFKAIHWVLNPLHSLPLPLSCCFSPFTSSQTPIHWFPALPPWGSLLQLPANQIARFVAQPLSDPCAARSRLLHLGASSAFCFCCFFPPPTFQPQRERLQAHTIFLTFWPSNQKHSTSPAHPCRWFVLLVCCWPLPLHSSPSGFCCACLFFFPGTHDAATPSLFVYFNIFLPFSPKHPDDPRSRLRFVWYLSATSDSVKSSAKLAICIRRYRT